MAIIEGVGIVKEHELIFGNSRNPRYDTRTQDAIENIINNLLRPLMSSAEFRDRKGYIEKQLGNVVVTASQDGFESTSAAVPNLDVRDNPIHLSVEDLEGGKEYGVCLGKRTVTVSVGEETFESRSDAEKIASTLQMVAELIPSPEDADWAKKI